LYVCPLIDDNFRHNIVKVYCGSWFHSHFEFYVFGLQVFLKIEYAIELQAKIIKIICDYLPGEKNSSVITGERKSSSSIESKSLISNWTKQVKFVSKLYLV